MIYGISLPALPFKFLAILVAVGELLAETGYVRGKAELSDTELKVAYLRTCR